MKHLLYTQFYSKRIFYKWLLIALVIVVLLVYLFSSQLNLGLNEAVVLIVVLTLISLLFPILVEFFHRSEYMSVHEKAEVEHVINSFLNDLKDDSFRYSRYFNPYDTKTKKHFEQWFLHEKHAWELYALRKMNGVYEVTLYDPKGSMIKELLLLWFGKCYMFRKMYVRLLNNEYTIVRIT